MSNCITSPQESEGLFRQAQAGDGESVAELMQRHDGLVHHIIRRQSGGPMSYEEVLQEGRIGLWRAILSYDVARGTAFSTYAGVAIAHQVWRAVKRRTTQDRDAVEASGLWGRDVMSVVLHFDPLEDLVEEAIKAEVRSLVAQLPSKQRHIVRDYYGLDGHQRQTLIQLGDQLGCTKQAVQYHLRRALHRLRHPAFSASLRSLLSLNRRQDYLQALRPRRRSS